MLLRVLSIACSAPRKWAGGSITTVRATNAWSRRSTAKRSSACAPNTSGSASSRRAPWKRRPSVHGTLLKLAGLALDARAITARDFVERAQTARWIAANALATRGIQLAIEGVAPRGARVCGLRATTFTAAIAAIAAVPVLIDAATLPAHWRYLLRALGMPVLTESPAAAI